MDKFDNRTGPYETVKFCTQCGQRDYVWSDSKALDVPHYVCYACERKLERNVQRNMANPAIVPRQFRKVSPATMIQISRAQLKNPPERG